MDEQSSPNQGAAAEANDAKDSHEVFAVERTHLHISPSRYMRRLMRELLVTLNVTTTGTGELRVRFSSFGIVQMEYTENHPKARP